MATSGKWRRPNRGRNGPLHRRRPRMGRMPTSESCDNRNARSDRPVVPVERSVEIAQPIVQMREKCQTCEGSQIWFGRVRHCLDSQSVDNEPQSLFYLALGVGTGMCAQGMVVPRSGGARLDGRAQANLAQGSVSSVAARRTSRMAMFRIETRLRSPASRTKRVSRVSTFDVFW